MSSFDEDDDDDDDDDDDADDDDDDDDIATTTFRFPCLIFLFSEMEIRSCHEVNTRKSTSVRDDDEITDDGFAPFLVVILFLS